MTDIKQEKSIYFYDEYIVTACEKFYEDMYNLSIVYKKFLKDNNISLEDFRKMILDYSLGYGLTYLDLLNENCRCCSKFDESENYQSIDF